MNRPARRTTQIDLPRELPQSWVMFFQDITQLAGELRERRALQARPEEAPGQDKRKAA
jgi:hypothetical protein